ncbi:DUF1643 domain-containing protein [Sphingobacteriales bacterium UPWRP_1]|nr:hypothetical protein BVG80_12245 [Sphingobacteriales bacterium TSM_CSM]PSJ75846.1 DUF1643 domain-containing protein [Sphingobacteriales bacterium UPWRP_1]
MHPHNFQWAVQEINIPEWQTQPVDGGGAVFSDCGLYRYRLWRIWNPDLPPVFWLMHNPSTAGYTANDPTLRRCINFTKSWGYGGLYVGNLFPYRATNPAALYGKTLALLIPPCNQAHLEQMAWLCTLHIAAFGNPVMPAPVPQLPGVRWYCLKTTKTNNPCHPLYVHGSETPKLFTPELTQV